MIVKARLRYLWHMLWVVPLVLALSSGIFFLVNLLTGNVHTVIAGRFYRSSQLTPAALQHIIQRYGIHSVVNLRGPYPRNGWYQAEIATTLATGVLHYNVRLPAHGLPTRQQLKTLVGILQSAPRPVLVHCHHGVDRAGLASALGILLFTDAPAREAMKQVSWRYNALSPTTVGYEVLQNYFVWLGQQQQHYGKRSFMQWLDSRTPMQRYWGAFLF